MGKGKYRRVHSMLPDIMLAVILGVGTTALLLGLETWLLYRGGHGAKGWMLLCAVMPGALITALRLRRSVPLPLVPGTLLSLCVYLLPMLLLSVLWGRGVPGRGVLWSAVAGLTGSLLGWLPGFVISPRRKRRIKR